VPVHPALAHCLDWWWNEGFELTYCRKPVLDDFIVPNRHPRSRGRGAHTKSSAYKAMARACKSVSVRFEGCRPDAPHDDQLGPSRRGACGRHLSASRTTRREPSSTSTRTSIGSRCAKPCFASTTARSAPRSPRSRRRRLRYRPPCRSQKRKRPPSWRPLMSRLMSCLPKQAKNARYFSGGAGN
jgi:hypothetical protein